MKKVTIVLDNEEEKYFEKYSQLTGESLSTLFKKALADRIEDEEDLKLYRAARGEYEKDTETISHAKLKKELG